MLAKEHSINTILENQQMLQPAEVCQRRKKGCFLEWPACAFATVAVVTANWPSDVISTRFSCVWCYTYVSASPIPKKTSSSTRNESENRDDVQPL
jgi:hypothetical protein